MAKKKYKYEGRSCYTTTPLGVIVWNDSTSQRNLKYGFEKKYKLEGRIIEIEVEEKTGEE